MGWRVGMWEGEKVGRWEGGKVSMRIAMCGFEDLRISEGAKPQAAEVAVWERVNVRAWACGNERIR